MFPQHSAASKSSSSMNTPTVFSADNKWSTCFKDVYLGFYFVWWVGFSTKPILKVFVASNIKYSTVYHSKFHTDTWNHVFSLKFNTCLWRLKNSEICNNCQDCQRWKKDVIMALQAEKKKKKNQNKLQNFQQIYQQSSVESVEYRFFFFLFFFFSHRQGRTHWIKRKMFLIAFWQVHVAYLNKTFVWHRLIKKKSKVQNRQRHWNENEHFPGLFFIGSRIDFFCF